MTSNGDSEQAPVFETETGYWLGYGRRFQSEDSAWQAIRDVQGFDAAVAPIRALPETLSREQYEAAAAELGIEQQPDKWLVWTTSCPRPPDGRLDQFLKTTLALRRRAGIEAERAARPKPVIHYVRCDCGHEVPEGQVMRASLGTSCLDCYDRMSH
jgi:hypothetical protein